MNQEEISVSRYRHHYPNTAEQEVMEEWKQDVGKEERVSVCGDEAWAQRC